jgi:hypothetical protein
MMALSVTVPAALQLSSTPSYSAPAPTLFIPTWILTILRHMRDFGMLDELDRRALEQAVKASGAGFSLDGLRQLCNLINNYAGRLGIRQRLVASSTPGAKPGDGAILQVQIFDGTTGGQITVVGSLPPDEFEIKPDP